MRWAVLFVVLSAVTASSQPAPKVGVLNVDVIGDDAETARIAGELTHGLRYPPFRNRKGPLEFTHETAQADFLIFGQLAAAPTGYKLTLQLRDVPKQLTERRYTRLIPAADIQHALVHHARAAYLSVIGAKTGKLALEVTPPDATVEIDGFRHAVTKGRVDVELAEGEHELRIEARDYLPHRATFTISRQPSKLTVALAIDKVFANCEYDGLVERGDTALASGSYAAALVHFEKALSCKQPEVKPLMLYSKLLMTACKTRNMPKAKMYLAKLPQPKREQLAQFCMPKSPPPW